MLSRTEDFSGTPLSLPCLFPLGRFRRALGPCGTEEGVLRGRRVLVFSSSSPRKFPSAVPTEAVSEPPYIIAPLSAGYNPRQSSLVRSRQRRAHHPRRTQTKFPDLDILRLDHVSIRLEYVSECRGRGSDTVQAPRAPHALHCANTLKYSRNIYFMTLSIQIGRSDSPTCAPPKARAPKH